MAKENPESGKEEITLKIEDQESLKNEDPMPAKKNKVKTIKMYHHAGGDPSEADVHPDCVEQWKSEGWMERE